tara:strand:- start:628 stop:1668 length:1041 start_codon:yes stop_codon:yes gene_type:complete
MANISINVGSLSSVRAVYNSTKYELNKFNKLWSEGMQPSVEWNLTDISIGKVNVAGLSFFLALAHRVRDYTGRPQEIVLEWHPKLFGFLYDISFFDIAEKYDLFVWPFVLGGYEVGEINPKTKILSYDKISSLPDTFNSDELSEWKKVHREMYRGDIIQRCSSLFEGIAENGKRNLPLVMSRTCAELVTNSLLWGRTTAFVGLQRTSSKIFISVSDVGLGLKRSFIMKHPQVSDLTDIQAISACSAINQNDFGLKRAIMTVLELSGDVTIISNGGEVHWGQSNWITFQNCISEIGFEKAVMELKADKEQKEKTNLSHYQNGYSVSLDHKIRGTRITFSIPVEKGAR